MDGGSGSEDSAAMIFGDRGTTRMGGRHGKAFQESRSSAGGGAPGGVSSLFGAKRGVDQRCS